MTRDNKIAMLMRQAGELHQQGEYLPALLKLDEAKTLIEAARRERFDRVVRDLKAASG